MSSINPGVIFDASCSWNGYNHQGKLGLWFAITEMNKLFSDYTESSVTEADFKKRISDYYLEIEYMEDFSILKVENGKERYVSVHQVKDKGDTALSSYDSAFAGLAYHLTEMPDIKHAYLHVTTEVSGQTSVQDRVKALCDNPSFLKGVLKKINSVKKSDDTKKEILKQKSTKEDFYAKLIKAYNENHTKKIKRLTDMNLLGDALDALELETDKLIQAFSKLNQTDLVKRIEMFQYDKFNQKYLPVDKCDELLKDGICKFITALPYLPAYMNQKEEVEKRFEFIIAKLIAHVVERDEFLKSNSKDQSLDYEEVYRSKRRIPFTVIYEWVTTSDIQLRSELYYVYKNLEHFIKQSEEYCAYCDACIDEETEHCMECSVIKTKKKIQNIATNEMKSFLYATCPTGQQAINEMTSADYVNLSGIQNPFYEGIKDIPIPYEEKNTCIVYKHNGDEYVLTTLLSNKNGRDIEQISSRIVSNRFTRSFNYKMRMDYDGFISRDLNSNSSIDEDAGAWYQKKKNTPDHIMCPKNTKLISLDKFLDLIESKEE